MAPNTCHNENHHLTAMKNYINVCIVNLQCRHVFYHLHPAVKPNQGPDIFIIRKNS